MLTGIHCKNNVDLRTGTKFRVDCYRKLPLKNIYLCGEDKLIESAWYSGTSKHTFWICGELYVLAEYCIIYCFALTRGSLLCVSTVMNLSFYILLSHLICTGITWTFNERMLITWVKNKLPIEIYTVTIQWCQVQWWDGCLN